MIWLFIVMLLAWLSFTSAIRSQATFAPKWAWWSLVITGASLLLIAIRFAFMERGDGFMASAIPLSDGEGAEILFIVFLNIFILLGPLGNALLWGGLGLFSFWNLFNGGWHRLAIATQSVDAQDAEKQDKIKRDKRTAKEYAAMERRKLWKAIGRFFARLINRKHK